MTAKGWEWGGTGWRDYEGRDETWGVMNMFTISIMVISVVYTHVDTCEIAHLNM